MTKLKSFKLNRSPKASNIFTNITHLDYPDNLKNNLISNSIELILKFDISSVDKLSLLSDLKSNEDKVYMKHIEQRLDDSIIRYKDNIVWYSQTNNELEISKENVYVSKTIRCYFDTPTTKEEIINDIILPLKLEI